MPELPEVETIKNDLKPYIVGHTITDVSFFCPKAVIGMSPEDLKRGLVGQTIRDIKRRGKYLIFPLSNGQYLIMHMKMSGSLIYSKANCEEVPRYTRTIFTLDNGDHIYFNDLRKFGMIWLVKDIMSIVGKLGPEPLTTEFTTELLCKILGKKQAPIKALLCDQELIAGIGNMYADEALFDAQIHPQESGKDLDDKKLEDLHRGINNVLYAGIAHYGASTSDYYRPDGTRGMAHISFKVAHRRGKTCPICGTTIQRITVRNRGTYFCPNCQQKRHPEK